MKIIFTGSGEFGVPTLRTLLASAHKVVQVVSQPDRPAGRGRGLTPTAISQVAIEANLPLLRTENINGETLTPADVMVVIAFGQKVADSIIHHPRRGSINLHASLLPKYRGAAPINWAIIHGEPTAGNSIIRLAQKMDAGAVLGQSELPIGETETAGELHDRLAEDGVRLVLKVLDELVNGTATETPQDPANVTVAPKLSRAAAKLDFTQTAIDVARRIRGLHPWPGCRVKMCDAAGGELAKFRLVRARPGPTEGDRWEPGEIMGDGMVQTGVGGLEIIDLQPDGRNVMSLQDYRRGHRWPPGARLVAVE